MERSLFITNYRNVGFKEKTHLVLNHSLEPDKMGDLVILVGPNNSGKSNVLDALLQFSNNSFQQRDITDLSFEDEDHKIELALVAKDENDIYSITKSNSHSPYIKFPSSEFNVNDYTFDNCDVTELTNEFDDLFSYIYSYDRASYNKQEYSNLKAQIKELFTNNDFQKNLFKEKVFELINLCKQSTSFKNAWSYFRSNRESSIFVKEIDSYLEMDKLSLINSKYKERYGTNFVPNILQYSETKLSNNNLITDYDNFQKSKFFTSIFQKLGFEASTITNAYKTFKQQNNRAILTTLQEQINEKLSSLSDDFNKLYFSSDAPYVFKIIIESTQIFFEIFRGSKPASLDFQSTGFKWFFNLYFSLLLTNPFNAGDILIMDEPATNLHVQGQRELREFLKDYAKKTGLTIVIATHSPFLVDCDCFDEIRTISNVEGTARINNDFTTYDPEDPDSLKPIKNSLTVHSHILYDPKEKLIYVEGITDYNYLTAMKEKLHIEEPIHFLPIQGVGNIKRKDIKEKQLAISKELIQISQGAPTLLVDGDCAGLKMQDTNKKDSALRVITLKEINEKFKTIESLFTEDDLLKLGIIAKNGQYIKHSGLSSMIKNHIDEYNLCEETLSNFKSLFDLLLD